VTIETLGDFHCPIDSRNRNINWPGSAAADTNNSGQCGFVDHFNMGMTARLLLLLRQEEVDLLYFWRSDVYSLIDREPDS